MPFKLATVLVKLITPFHSILQGLLNERKAAGARNLLLNLFLSCNQVSNTDHTFSKEPFLKVFLNKLKKPGF
jgi:hypothetical protein